MTCQDLIARLLEYLDGEFSAEHVTWVEAHLPGCDGCRFYIESYTHTTTVVRTLRCGPLPDDLGRRLWAGVQARLAAQGG